jgi:hypothetical protein
MTTPPLRPRALPTYAVAAALLALYAVPLASGCGDDDSAVDLGATDLGPRDLGAEEAGPRSCERFDGGDLDLGLSEPLPYPITEIPDAGAADDGGVDAGPFGCVPLRACLGTPDESSPLTYESFAAPLFATYCTRCHSTALVGADARSGAPASVNLDDRASVYANLREIRQAAGVLNYMPLDAPRLPCELRARLVQWIDTGAD